MEWGPWHCQILNQVGGVGGGCGLDLGMKSRYLFEYTVGEVVGGKKGEKERSMKPLRCTSQRLWRRNVKRIGLLNWEGGTWFSGESCDYTALGGCGPEFRAVGVREGCGEGAAQFLPEVETWENRGAGKQASGEEAERGRRGAGRGRAWGEGGGGTDCGRR